MGFHFQISLSDTVDWLIIASMLSKGEATCSECVVANQWPQECAGDVTVSSTNLCRHWRPHAGGCGLGSITSTPHLDHVASPWITKWQCYQQLLRTSFNTDNQLSAVKDFIPWVQICFSGSWCAVNTLFCWRIHYHLCAFFIFFSIAAVVF